MGPTNAGKEPTWKEKIQELREVVNKCCAIAKKSTAIRKSICGRFNKKIKQNLDLTLSISSNDFNYQFDLLINEIHNELDTIDENLDEIS